MPSLTLYETPISTAPLGSQNLLFWPKKRRDSFNIYLFFHHYCNDFVVARFLWTETKFIWQLENEHFVSHGFAVAWK